MTDLLLLATTVLAFAGLAALVGVLDRADQRSSQPASGGER